MGEEELAALGLRMVLRLIELYASGQDHVDHAELLDEVDRDRLKREAALRKLAAATGDGKP